MKVENTRRIRNKLVELYGNRALNCEMAAVFHALDCEESVVKNPYELWDGADEMMLQFPKEERTKEAREELVFIQILNMLTSHVFDEVGKALRLNGEFWRAEDFESNAYIQRIKFDEQECGDFVLTHRDYKAYELASNGIFRIPGVIAEFPKIRCFLDNFSYPCIRQKSIDQTWMSVTPTEIETMAEPIEYAAGKVLTLGLGMGYFTYHAHLKDNVESVTVIEKEQDVINLFEKYILPQFDYPEKIKIIKADAVDYVKTLNDGEFDYCFADIWISNMDVEPYMAVKEIARRFKKTKMEYWIEENLAGSFITFIYIELMKTAGHIMGMEIDKNSVLPVADFDRKMDYVHKLFKKTEIKRPEDIDACFDPKEIIKMINKAKFTY